MDTTPAGGAHGQAGESTRSESWTSGVWAGGQTGVSRGQGLRKLPEAAPEEVRRTQGGIPELANPHPPLSSVPDVFSFLQDREGPRSVWPVAGHVIIAWHQCPSDTCLSPVTHSLAQPRLLPEPGTPPGTGV